MVRASLSDDTVIEPASGLDYTRVSLTPEEGFLFSRLEGRRQKIVDVKRAVPWPPEKVLATVEALARKAVVIVVGGLGTTTSSETVDYAGFVFPVAAMIEKTDLNEEQRKRILFVEAKLDEWNHYALLGLKRTAPSSDIKRAYFKASKEFHPDAFFRKELGTFRGRVDKIFRAMKAAYDVLSDPERRSAYDAVAVTGFTPEELKELEALAEQQRAKEAEKLRDERLAERLKEKRLKHNPMIERLQKARDYMKLAEDALAAGKFAEAPRHAKLAVEYAPQDEALKKRVASLTEEANRGQAHALLKRVDTMLKTMEGPQLADAGEQLATLGPKDADVLTAAAKLLAAGGRPQRALRFAQQAVGIAPKHKAGLELLFTVARDEKSWNIALRASETLAGIDPKSASYKDWVKLAKRNV